MDNIILRTFELISSQIDFLSEHGFSCEKTILRLLDESSIYIKEEGINGDSIKDYLLETLQNADWKLVAQDSYKADLGNWVVYRLTQTFDNKDYRIKYLAFERFNH